MTTRPGSGSRTGTASGRTACWHAETGRARNTGTHLMNVDIESAYIVLESRNAAALNTYLGDVIGLMPGAPTRAAAFTWRADCKAQRVVVVPGESNDAICIGFE